MRKFEFNSAKAMAQLKVVLDLERRLEKVKQGEDVLRILETELEVTEERSKLEIMLEPLQKEISKIEGRCYCRCYSAESMINHLLELQAKLDISKTALNGVSVFCNPWSASWNARYPAPRGTTFSADYRRNHWVVHSIAHDQLPYGLHKDLVCHTTRSLNTIIDHYTKIR